MGRDSRDPYLDSAAAALATQDPEQGEAVVIDGVKHRIRGFSVEAIRGERVGVAHLAKAGPTWRVARIEHRVAVSALRWDHVAGVWRLA